MIEWLEENQRMVRRSIEGLSPMTQSSAGAPKFFLAAVDQHGTIQPLSSRKTGPLTLLLL